MAERLLRAGAKKKLGNKRTAVGSDPIGTQAESDARAKKLGLWQDANPVNPYEFRKMSKKR